VCVCGWYDLFVLFLYICCLFFICAFPLVPPLKVDISKVETRFVAGESSEIRCQTFGSRPAASISWWKDNVRLSDSSYKVSALCHSVPCSVSRSYVSYGVPTALEMALGLVSSRSHSQPASQGTIPLWPARDQSRNDPTQGPSACDIGGVLCLIHDRLCCEVHSVDASGAHLFRNADFYPSGTLLPFVGGETLASQRPCPSNV
jgi:hypothetical protein